MYCVHWWDAQQWAAAAALYAWASAPSIGPVNWQQEPLQAQGHGSTAIRQHKMTTSCCPPTPYGSAHTHNGGRDALASVRQHTQTDSCRHAVGWCGAIVAVVWGAAAAAQSLMHSWSPALLLQPQACAHLAPLPAEYTERQRHSCTHSPPNPQQPLSLGRCASSRDPPTTRSALAVPPCLSPGGAFQLLPPGCWCLASSHLAICTANPITPRVRCSRPDSRNHLQVGAGHAHCSPWQWHMPGHAQQACQEQHAPHNLCPPPSSNQQHPVMCVCSADSALTHPATTSATPP